MRLVPLLLRAAILGLFALGAIGRGGIAPFTDPGKIDFDTAMGLLNPYGTWAKLGDKWAFSPLDHATPYTNGRWLYTEEGWYWQGNSPYSWMTEHYGYWKRSEDKVWAWYPGPYWLPQTVEIRASPDGIGWRSAEVDRDGNFVEQPADRYTKIDEWTFVTPARFAGPITPAVIAKAGDAERLLEESTDSIHSYLTYREINRPGPHPADFINLGDSRMFAPMTEAERAKAMRQVAASSPAKPDKTVAATNAAPTAPTTDPNRAAKLAASLTASTEIPEIPQVPGGQDPVDDPRQVKYWVTMCLPTRWTKPPVDAKRDELYVYRPDFYQDQDGIERRIALWLNPSLRSSEAIHLQDVLNSNHRSGVTASSAPGAPAVPAEPAGSDFTSPFEQAYPNSSATTPNASTKVNPRSSAGAPVSDAGISTNAAPAGRAQQ